IKKFFSNARSNPENQARTLHSLNLILDYFIKNGLMKKRPFSIGVAEAIAYKGPFLAMRDLSGSTMVRSDKLPTVFREEVHRAMLDFGRLISLSENRMQTVFANAGLLYPTPDFIPSNIICHVKNGRFDRAWIIDQFHDPKAVDPRLRRESVSRIWSKWSMGQKRK
ncbi:MAG: hypothetical protein Q7R47_04745, partial [Candidatus Diapherotrites archaeon]|nr:hypothetical protein [Candidatus Diapherotrites archaeon]